MVLLQGLLAGHKLSGVAEFDLYAYLDLLAMQYGFFLSRLRLWQTTYLVLVMHVEMKEE